MNTTGIVRKIDQLGRIVLPIELRRILNIDITDTLEIFHDGERIILKRYAPACLFCGSANENVYFKGILICRACINELV
ncbi:AbrB/MazE/SpoVT family DNA-binding domain-containing protein [Paenibacillus anseongense]|uniref:AbrB/MazE/SpoVT family DNA-binding domain-containing protein n=1 Tax=Paenibacillus anseongense TaxID=2682845 RepID=UPI002DB5A7C3|nr:AbrB/MazE/SpoVT family DNA-binding domain-containing protein [Paenibacillus anseongense]MEC0270766.1 AbrB/MazE/SpoVT family DNA-binding domain-containing protein [Paenibacillus anseongense]